MNTANNTLPHLDLLSLAIFFWVAAARGFVIACIVSYCVLTALSSLIRESHRKRSSLYLFVLHRRLGVGVGGLRHLDSRIAVTPARWSSGGGCDRGPWGCDGVALLLLLLLKVVVQELRSRRGEPLAERGLLLQHPLYVGVTRRLLQLLAVHPVPERIHHPDLEGQQSKN